MATREEMNGWMRDHLGVAIGDAPAGDDPGDGSDNADPPAAGPSAAPDPSDPPQPAAAPEPPPDPPPAAAAPDPAQPTATAGDDDPAPPPAATDAQDPPAPVPVDQEWVNGYLGRHSFSWWPLESGAQPPGVDYGLDGQPATLASVIAALEAEATGAGRTADPEVEEWAINAYLKVLGPAPVAPAATRKVDPDWVNNFLVHHQVAASSHPELQTIGGTYYDLDGGPVSEDQLYSSMEDEAATAGLTADRDIERAAVAAYLKARDDGKSAADSVKTGIDADNPQAAIQQLQRMDMVGILAALRQLRADGKLDALRDLASDARIKAAILTIDGNIGEEWKQATAALSDADMSVLRGEVLGQDDHGGPAVAKGIGFADPGGDDLAWLKGFFAFVDLQAYGPDFLFQRNQKTLNEVIDLTSGQVAAAGRLIDAALIREQAQSYGAAHPASYPPAKGDDDTERKLVQDEKGVVSASIEASVGGKIIPPVKMQFKTSSEGLELQASEQVKKDLAAAVRRLGLTSIDKLELQMAFNATVSADPGKVKSALLAFKTELEAGHQNPFPALRAEGRGRPGDGRGQARLRENDRLLVIGGLRPLSSCGAAVIPRAPSCRGDRRWRRRWRRRPGSRCRPRAGCWAARRRRLPGWPRPPRHRRPSRRRCSP
jgi:hypothetical protein